MDYAYYNGVIAPYDATVITLGDRAVFFGDAVYDVMLGRGGKVYQTKEHLARLRSGAEHLGINPRESDEAIGEIIETLIKESELDEYTVYLQISGYCKRREHKSGNEPANLLITLTETVTSDELREISAVTLSDLRYGYCNIKTVNLLPAVISVNTAYENGAETAIFHKGGKVTECSSANISILSGGKLITHPLDSEILPGIMRANLLCAAQDMGIEIVERAFTVDELMRSDAALITSTTRFLKLCTKVDGILLPREAEATAKELFRRLYINYIEQTC